jgi:hypothetical protein
VRRCLAVYSCFEFLFVFDSVRFPVYRRVSTKAVHAREINALTATLLEKEDEIDQLSHHNFESIEGIMELFMVCCVWARWMA